MDVEESGGALWCHSLLYFIVVGLFGSLGSVRLGSGGERKGSKRKGSERDPGSAPTPLAASRMLFPTRAGR